MAQRKTELALPVRIPGDPGELSEGDQLIHTETLEVITLKRRPRNGGLWWLASGGIIRDAVLNPTPEQRPTGSLYMLIERRP